MQDLGVTPVGDHQLPPAAAGKIKKPPVRRHRRPVRDEAAADTSAEDQALFAQAMAALERVPDKDARTRPRAVKPQAPRRGRPPKAREVTVEDRLDLHRERQDRALERLRDFLVAAAVRRLGTVLVVTGKGYHSADGQGVLRQAVESWLIRFGTPWVAHFSAAPRELGGRGAWLLELRK